MITIQLLGMTKEYHGVEEAMEWLGDALALGLSEDITITVTGIGGPSPSDSPPREESPSNPWPLLALDELLKDFKQGLETFLKVMEGFNRPPGTGGKR